MQNVVNLPGAGAEVPVVVVDFNVVVVFVANGSKVMVVEDGGAGADGRTRHGRMESMEWEKKSTTEMNFMLELWALPYRTVLSHPTFASSIIDVYSNKERLRVNTAVNGQGQMSENGEQYKKKVHADCL